MAVTHWPDFSTANLTDWTPIQTLLDAIRERANVLRCIHLPSRNAEHSLPTDLVPEALKRDVPRMDVLVGIRSAICRLAAFYVDPDNDEWHNNGSQDRGSVDVPVFGASAPIRVGADHSLAILPDVASCEADSAALALYRAFLANVAWWLDSFRYVDASERATYKSKLVTLVNTQTEDWSEITDALNEPTVTTPDGGYPLRTINRYGYPSGCILTVDEKISFDLNKNDTYPPASYNDTPHEDDWQAGSLETFYSCRAICYDGLSVVNPTPLDADICLLPSQYWPLRTIERCNTGNVEFVGYEHFDYEAGHYRLQSYTESDQWWDWFGDGLKLRDESTSIVTATGEDKTLTIVPTIYSRTYTLYHNSPDGTVVESEVSTESGTGTMRNMCGYTAAFYNESLSAFDAFGTNAELGVLLSIDTVAGARSTTKIDAWNVSESIPIADGWENHPTDATELHAPGPQRRSLMFELSANLRLAVIFDFGPHFQYGGYDAEH